MLTLLGILLVSHATAQQAAQGGKKTDLGRQVDEQKKASFPASRVTFRVIGLMKTKSGAT